MNQVSFFTKTFTIYDHTQLLGKTKNIIKIKDIYAYIVIYIIFYEFYKKVVFS